MREFGITGGQTGDGRSVQAGCVLYRGHAGVTPGWDYIWASMGCSPGAPRLEGPHHLKKYISIDTWGRTYLIMGPIGLLAQEPLKASIRLLSHTIIIYKTPSYITIFPYFHIHDNN